jgi:hypothetical protein
LKEPGGRPAWAQRLIIWLAFLVPYWTVPLGLFVLHNAWAAILFFHMAMLLVLFWQRDRWKFRLGRLQRGGFIIPLMLLPGIAGGIAMWGLWSHLSVDPDMTNYLKSIGLGFSNWPFFVAYFVAVNPWLEEIYWRSFLDNQSRYPFLGDIMFAGYHLLVLAGRIGNIWLSVILITLLIGAWGWRQINHWCGGIWPSAVCHWAADLTVMLMIFWLVF